MVVKAKTDEGASIIDALPKPRKEQLDDLLIKGIPAREVAKIVQDTWKIWVSDKPATVKKRLERYRSGSLKKALLARAAGVNEGVRTATLAKRLNAQDELEALVNSQKLRFAKALNMEDKAPLLLKQATEEARLLKEMIVELGRLQLETGALQRAPKKIKGTMTDAEGVAHNFEWTQEQEALLSEIDAAMSTETAYVSLQE